MESSVAISEEDASRWTMKGDKDGFSPCKSPVTDSNESRRAGKEATFLKAISKN